MYKLTQVITKLESLLEGDRNERFDFRFKTIGLLGQQIAQLENSKIRLILHL